MNRIPPVDSPVGVHEQGGGSMGAQGAAGGAGRLCRRGGKPAHSAPAFAVGKPLCERRRGLPCVYAKMPHQHLSMAVAASINLWF